MMKNTTEHVQHVPWNKGVIVGQKAPFKLKEIWAIRVRLQLQHRVRELAMFDLGLDCKLRACDLVKMRVHDICHGEHVSPRATVMQQKTSRPVQFEITQPTRDAVSDWIKEAKLGQDDYFFSSRTHESPHIGTRQYARILDSCVTEIGLHPSEYGTHSMRRTKASLIYRRTKNLRAVQLLLGHTKLESTVRYLGIEVNDALEMAEQTEI
jgi:integrase